MKITTADSTNNEKLFAEITSDTGATYEEAYTMCELDCTLEEAQKSITQGKAYERLLVQLLPGNIEYFRDKYKDMGISEDFIQSEAKELTEEQAYMFIYEWEQYEDTDEQQ